MGNFRIPVPIAVLAWAASGLAVLSYTYIAFKETAGGEDADAGLLSAKNGEKELNELVSTLPQLKGPLVPMKPLIRGRFNKSKGK